MSSVFYLGSGQYRINFSSPLDSDGYVLVGSTNGAATLGEAYPAQRTTSFVHVAVTDGSAIPIRRGGSVTIYDAD